MNRKKKNLLLAVVILILAVILLVIFMFGKERNRSIAVGIVLTGSIDEPGWNKYHYMGLKTASEGLNVNLMVEQNVEEFSGKCENAVERLINKGAKLIILGSYNYGLEIADLIKENPEISFFNVSSGENSADVPVFFVRAYQARYLAGIVAGKQTENNMIGYVAAMPNSEVNRGINAFTLGVQSVNPDAKVYVNWTGSWSDEEKERSAVRELVENVGVDLITYHQNQDFVVSEAEKYGIYSIGYHEYMEGYSERYLTAVQESWENVYSEILKKYMYGQTDNNHLIWLGIEKDAVKLAPCTSLVSDETKQLIDDTANRMKDGWEVFSDLIISADEEIKCQKGEAITDDILFSKMDWFVKGIILYENQY